MMRMLSAVGRAGPWILCAAALAGLALPTLARAASPFMGWAVAAFAFGVFVRADLGELRRASRCPLATAGALLGCVALVPLAGVGAARALGLPADMALGVALVCLAPPSAAAIAAMLGLDATLAAAAMAGAALAAPWTMPWLAHSVGVAVSVDSSALAANLAWLVGPPALLAAAFKLAAPARAARARDSATGVATLGLAAMAVGAMDGVSAMAQADPMTALGYMAGAYGLNVALQALGAALSPGLSRADALTMGLCYGNRNVGLVWAACGSLVVSRPLVELFLSMSLLAVFTIPVAQKLWGRRRGKPAPVSEPLPERAPEPGRAARA